MKNKAILEFENNKLTDFHSWYTPDVITYLTYLNKQTELLRYTFFDGDFKAQFQSINMLKNGLEQGFNFICKEPGIGQNHFIFGILIENKLIFINPVGETAHKNFYEIAALIKKDYNLDIYLSNTIIQKDTNLGNEGIVSCGPICVELIRYISLLSEKEILSFLETSTSITIQTKYKLEYKEINIKALLPESLNSLETTDLINYQHLLEEIRKQHLKILTVDPLITNLRLEEQNEFLENNCINHPIQVEIRKFTQESNLLESVDRIKEYLLQQKQIMSKTILKQETTEDVTSSAELNTDYSQKEKSPIKDEKLVKANALGNDRNLAEDGMNPQYWYSVGDGFRLALWLRQHYLNYDNIPIAKDGEEYTAFRENGNRILVTDPYYTDNFNDYLGDDVARITATSNFHALTPWIQMPTTIIIPLLSGLHWRTIKVEINYNSKTANILFDDPYGKAAFPETLKLVIIPVIKSNIEKLIRVQTKDNSFNLINEIPTDEKPYDQQGYGENSWDCGPITFSNIETYIKYSIDKTTTYFIPEYTDTTHKKIIATVRTTDIQHYSEVAGIIINHERVEEIRQHLEKLSQVQNQKLKELGSVSFLDLSNLDSLQVSMIFEVLDNKRLFEGKEKTGKYTKKELDYAYQIVLGEIYTDKYTSPKNLSATDNKKEPTDYFHQIREKANNTVSYTAHLTAETGHPDDNRKLSKVVDQVLKDKEITTLEVFHTKVYELLWQEPEFQKLKYIYKFKCKISYNSRSVEIGESDNLLFWLLANSESGKVLTILDQYKFDIETIKDNNDNNILHIAALYGNHSVINKIVDLYFDGLITPHQFRHLINHRNNDGTNPLGMAFLSNLSHEKLIKVTELFVLTSFFEVNSYLNDKRGMDVLANDFLKQIGGFNILHMALIEKYPKILEILYIRHKKGDESDTDLYYVNFRYPSLNPAYHMNSPEKVLKKIIFSKPPKRDEKTQCEILLKKYQLEQLQKEEEEDSGDSDDENSSAYIWKHVLIDMMESPAITKSEGTYVVPLFHGIPLMSGLYTHSDRKYVGKKLMLLNPGLTEKTKSIIKKQLGDSEAPADELKAVHSRTSTASAGMENLAKIAKANDSTLNRLSVIDDTLKSGLQKAFQQNNGIFKAQVVSFVNKFSSDVAHIEVWQNLTKINEELNNDLIVKYRFPLISTSKTADHGTKYGFGTNLELPRGEGKLEPYYKHGKPQHRLAGFLYVIKENANEITEKLKSGKIFDICSLGGINALFQKQIEIAYLGGISKENILAIIPLIYPNFSKGFDPNYHVNVLSFSDKSAYTRAKTDFGKPELTEDGGLILTQQTGTHKGQPNTLGACLTNIFVHFAEKITLKFSDGILVSKLPNQQDFIEYTTSQNYRLASTDFTSPNHKMLSQSKSKNSPSPKSIKVVKKLFQDTEMDSLTGQINTLNLQNKTIQLSNISSIKIIDGSPVRLREAAHNGDEKEVTALLTTITQEAIIAPDENGHTALHHAAYSGHKKIIELLLTKMSKEIINATDSNGYTALYWAEQQGFKEIVVLIQIKTQEMPLQQTALETEILVEAADTSNTNTHQLEHLGNILEHQQSDFL